MDINKDQKVTFEEFKRCFKNVGTFPFFPSSNMSRPHELDESFQLRKRPSPGSRPGLAALLLRPPAAFRNLLFLLSISLEQPESGFRASQLPRQHAGARGPRVFPRESHGRRQGHASGEGAAGQEHQPAVQAPPAPRSLPEHGRSPRRLRSRWTRSWRDRRRTPQICTACRNRCGNPCGT